MRATESTEYSITFPGKFSSSHANTWLDLVDFIRHNAMGNIPIDRPFASSERLQIGNISASNFPPPTPAGNAAASVGRRIISGGDSLSFGLLLALRAGNGTPGLPTDLGNHVFPLAFRQVFDQQVVGLL